MTGAVRWSRLARLWQNRTVVARFASAYLSFFALSCAILFLLIYAITADFVRVRADQAIEQEARDLATTLSERGWVPLLASIGARSKSENPDRIYALATPGLQITAGNLSAWPTDDKRGGWVDVMLKGHAIRPDIPVRALILPIGQRGWLLVGQSMAERYLLLQRLRQALLWSLALALGLGGLGGWIMSQSVSARIAAINANIDAIIRNRFAGRMPVSGRGDEIDRLMRKLNEMLEEINRLMLSMRAVTDDIAHDLRTPLARLRAQLDLTLHDQALPPEQREPIEEALAQADQLLALFRAMLTIAALDGGDGQQEMSDLDLAATLKDVIGFWEPAAEECGMRLSLSIEVAHPRLKGHPALLAQMLSNLIENAIKYGRPDDLSSPAPIQVRLFACPEASSLNDLQHPAPSLAISIADRGSGIPTDQMEHALQRFGRLETHRNAPGHGLGLSLVVAIARLHGATLTLEDAQPGLRAIVHFAANADGA
jgi:signal transduction histidine kinase